MNLVFLLIINYLLRICKLFIKISLNLFIYEKEQEYKKKAMQNMNAKNHYEYKQFKYSEIFI